MHRIAGTNVQGGCALGDLDAQAACEWLFVDVRMQQGAIADLTPIGQPHVPAVCIMVPTHVIVAQRDEQSVVLKARVHDLRKIGCAGRNAPGKDRGGGGEQAFHAFSDETAYSNVTRPITYSGCTFV